MAAVHHYHTKIEWTGNKGTGTSGYAAYERSHTIQTGHKIAIEASSDPHFRGDDTKYNPEELFLASIASCHMLWYLHLCADSGIVVNSYNDKAYGEMQTYADGSGYFTKIILSPDIVITDEAQINHAVDLHHKAHQFCFLANSVNFEILIEPRINEK